MIRHVYMRKSLFFLVIHTEIVVIIKQKVNFSGEEGNCGSFKFITCGQNLEKSYKCKVA